jgi:hypothetical protein
MKLKFYTLLGVLCLFSSIDLFAQMNVNVTMSSVSVSSTSNPSGLCDLDAPLCCCSNCRPSDPQWDADVSDNYGNSENFSHEESNTNSPGTVTGGYDNFLNFNATYRYCAPSSLSVFIEGRDDDVAGGDARGDRNTTLPIVPGTNIYQRTITVTGTPCGTVVWRFNFRVQVTGSAEGCGDECTDAIDISPSSTPGCGGSPRTVGNGLANIDLDFRNGGPAGPSTSSNFGAPAPTCGNFGSGRRDVWFRATIPAGRTGLDIEFENNSGCGTFCNTDIAYAVYGGSCGNLTLESCDEIDCVAGVACYGKKISIFGNPGETKYIRMWEEDNDGFRVEFPTSSVQGICAAAGDDCGSPVNLPTPGEFMCQGSQPGDSIITSGLPRLNYTDGSGVRPGPSLNMIGVDAPDCWDNVLNSGADAYTREDAWIRVQVADNSGGVTLQFANNGGCEADPGNLGACQSNVNYSWYTSSDGTCNGLEYRGCGSVSCFIGCNDGEITVDGREGEFVWIRIWEEENQGFDITFNEIRSIAPADRCYTALPLGPTGCNYQATSPTSGTYAEPDLPSWTDQAHPDLNPAVCSSCICQDGDGDPGTNTVWASNENMVWYTFNHPGGEFNVAVDNMSCVGGASTAQLGVFSNSGTAQDPSCNLAAETGYGCAVGVGQVQLSIPVLPAGEYILVVDGNAGAQCVWEFYETIGGDPLPIQLIEFNARFNEDTKNVDLNWKSAEEENFAGFTVERSTDAVDFFPIDFVEGVGSEPGSTNTYSYEDASYPRVDVLYYRLRLDDLDGSFKYTNVKAVSPNIEATGISVLYDVYPNPTTNTLYVPFQTVKEDEVSAVIYDMSGRVVKEIVQGEKYQQGYHILEADVNDLAQGVYVIRFTAGNLAEMQRFIKY